MSFHPWVAHALSHRLPRLVFAILLNYITRSPQIFPHVLTEAEHPNATGALQPRKACAACRIVLWPRRCARLSPATAWVECRSHAGVSGTPRLDWQASSATCRAVRHRPVDVARLVELTTQTKPKAATHWSTRTRRQSWRSAASSRHWRANGLSPIVRGFKVSRDPKFVEKLEDIVGLYIRHPSTHWYWRDEKSQVQALDRTQPGLPLKKGRAETMTQDYKRNGTTTLFAALNVLDGQVIGQCQQHHTHAEWLKFLKKIDREPQEQDAASDCRQLRHAQTSRRAGLACKHPRSTAFHTDLGVVAQHGRAILPRHHHRAPRRGVSSDPN